MGIERVLRREAAAHFWWALSGCSGAKRPPVRCAESTQSLRGAVALSVGAHSAAVSPFPTTVSNFASTKDHSLSWKMRLAPFGLVRFQVIFTELESAGDE